MGNLDRNFSRRGGFNTTKPYFSIFTGLFIWSTKLEALVQCDLADLEMRGRVSEKERG